MEVSDGVKEEVRTLMERFWKDIAGLPWQDKSWSQNEAQREQTRQHFVNATANDVIDVIQGGMNADTTSKNG